MAKVTVRVPVLTLREKRRVTRGRCLMLGLGTLVGATLGLLFAPTTGRTLRTRLAQRGGRTLRVAGRRADATVEYLGNMASGRVRAVTSRTDHDTEPETIAHRVQTELGEDKELSSLPRLNVNAEPGGVVYLRGALPSEQLRRRAEKVARRARGVEDVINEIAVVPGPVRSGPGGELPELGRRIQAALGRDRDVGSERIEVHAEAGGIVYLRGTVRSKRERERAERVASRVEGISEVINDLAIVSPAPDVVERDRNQG